MAGEQGTSGGRWMLAGMAAAAVLALTAVLTPELTRPGEGALKPGERFRECSVCPEMVVMPAGSFLMGTPGGEGSDDERPQHAIAIAKPFAVARLEATFAEWDACADAGGCKLKPEDNGWGRGDQPVTNVSWDDTREYLAWLGTRTGKPYLIQSGYLQRTPRGRMATLTAYRHFGIVAPKTAHTQTHTHHALAHGSSK